MTKKEPAFYACDKCGIMIEEICGEKEEFSCCGIPLKKLTPNTSDGAQ